MEKIFENYEVFYNMIMSTTLLSNSQNEVYAHDAGKIIDFYAEAYDLNNDLTKNMKQVILFDLISFGLNSDKEVEKQNRAFDRNYDINDKINEVYGDMHLKGVKTNNNDYELDALFIAFVSVLVQLS